MLEQVGQVENNDDAVIPEQPQNVNKQGVWDYITNYTSAGTSSLKNGLSSGRDTFMQHKGKSIALVLLVLIAVIVFQFVYKGEGHSHAVPMDAPAGAKVCRDVTTLMADNGFTNYTLKQNFVEFGGEMILACPHRETEGDITITCSEEGEIALVNNQCLATDECS
eukprot:911069_1